MATVTPDIDEALVSKLIEHQFPRWAHLPVVAASPQGWDNRTFRLGDELTVRLPSAAGYAHQIAKESRWLPYLRQHLPVRVPRPLALGRPALGYPFAWSVSAWLDGQVLSRADHPDQAALAQELASFLVALRAVPIDDAPRPGPETAYRGGPFAHYAAEARAALRSLGVRSPVADEVVDEAVASHWEGAPVWFHGDVAVDNLLVDDRGRLSGVLDFGCSGVGDPACDLVIAFTYFDDEARPVFRRAAEVDDDTWRRARGWAIWKAAITLADPGAPAPRRAEQDRALAAVLAEASR
ncbi:aminoglycoside phosphotransferase family protein [Nonomuraea pusilla]|uniref:aminoglycoside phosphotransferase family protein n=1 Tax=Nonomuraea pusilla TaxID=46177 RepID=UPI003318941C